MAIKRCTCANAYQDKKYGYEMRVANLCKNGTYRCTICCKSLGRGTDDDKKAKK